MEASLLTQFDFCYNGLFALYNKTCVVDMFEAHHTSLTLRTVRPIYRTGVPLPSRCCILYIFFNKYKYDYFKHAAHSPFFPYKCRLFHNATFFGFCNIHILHTGVLKFQSKTPVPKG
jgi:hypothetical protein